MNYLSWFAPPLAAFVGWLLASAVENRRLDRQLDRLSKDRARLHLDAHRPRRVVDTEMVG